MAEFMIQEKDENGEWKMKRMVVAPDGCDAGGERNHLEKLNRALMNGMRECVLDLFMSHGVSPREMVELTRAGRMTKIKVGNITTVCLDGEKLFAYRQEVAKTEGMITVDITEV